MEQSASTDPPAGGHIIADDSPPPPSRSLREQFPFASTAEDIIDIRRFSNQCQEYNRLVPFAQMSAAAVTGSLASQCGADIEVTVREINEIMNEFGGRLCSKMLHLDRQLKKFSEATYVEDGCYEDVDLLTLTTQEISSFVELFEANRWNLDRFKAYMDRIIPEAIAKAPPENEVQPEDSGQMFLEKCFLLVQIVVNQGSKVEAFHLLIRQKLLCRRTNARISEERLRFHHRKLDHAIHALVSQDERGQSDDCKNAMTCLTDSLSIQSSHRQAFKHRHRAATTPCFMYWNFALAARTLRDVYLDRLCDGTRADPDGFDAGKCFHAESVAILNWLRMAAWLETREAVFMTLGTMFPTELTEQIFECALETEEVPMDSSVYESFMADPSSFIHKQYAQNDRKLPGPRQWVRVKAMYKCGRMHDADSDGCFQLDDGQD